MQHAHAFEPVQDGRIYIEKLNGPFLFGDKGTPEEYAAGLEAQERLMTVLIYVDTSKQVGDPDHLKVFANQDAAETWFEENDPEGVAFEYEVLE